MSTHEARFKHGLAMHQQGRLADAERAYQNVLRKAPNHVDALHLLGVISLQSGRHQLGVDLIGKALLLNGGSASAYGNRGAGLLALNRPGEAVESFDRAIALDPGYIDAYYYRGNALLALGRPADAVASYDRAIALKPGLTEAHGNRGTALLKLGQPQAALESYDRALALDGAHVDALYNRGNALMELRRPADAIASYDRAVAIKPELAEGWYNRGNALRELQRYEEAVDSYRQALALKPDHVKARWNQSLALLALGEYERGWPQHESRWETELAHAKPDLPGLPWYGESSISGKTILIVAEQGFGDSLQFCRYVPMLAALGAKVVLEVPRPLTRVCATLEGVGTIIAPGDRRPDFDEWTSMVSLPLAFRTTLATIPARMPYLHPNPDRASAWRERLSALPGRRIGIVWAGSTNLGDPRFASLDARRSLALAQYAPLADVRGVSLISLQKGPPAAQAKTPPDGMLLHDWTDELTDFADTAALVDGLDLVISIDTSVVHLAGALGKPVWVLNRFDQCWRWLRGRTDSPWYPSARVFQQSTPGDWAGVIVEVVAALHAVR